MKWRRVWSRSVSDVKSQSVCENHGCGKVSNSKWINHAQIHPQDEARPTMSNDTMTLQSELRIGLALLHFKYACTQSMKHKIF